MSGLTRNQLTSESKALLRKTVRGLRESLIAQLKESAEQRYLLSVPLAKVKLGAEPLEHRRRLEAALDQAAAEEGGGKEARTRAFETAARQAGATLLNRLVLIRHLEALGLSKPAVLTGGWMSKGYREFQSIAGALCEDETQGMRPLLELLFAELAVPLPGLFGEVGLTKLFPVSAATLRQVIEALDAVPADAWSDDLTLGWVYQFWNDPDREALDAKIAASGKIEPHEIASKTQMFTERYMVEWLLQNSLGATWLAMCKKNGWTPAAESTGTLKRLDERRAEWRKKRETGEVALDALMPIDGVLEEAWKYYVPQPTPDAVVEHAPESIRELKLLDPACGSGHFLLCAFDLLVELYREEARHRGESWSDRQIAEWILENNLHGIDIDPRAVQIAAAAVYLKARALAKDADPKQVNLVAPALKLSALDEKDPGLVKLEKDIERDTGIPPELTRELIQTLAGVDHLGSLLKVGDAIDKALQKHEGAFATRSNQTEMFSASDGNRGNSDRRAETSKVLARDAAKKIVMKRLEGFLAKHSAGEDLGLRLRGQQLSAGLRFATIAKEGEYHVVVGNPPYQDTERMSDVAYVARHFPRSKTNLYAAFIERGLQFCVPSGVAALVTMRNWMFLKSFSELRGSLLADFDLRLLGDVDRGGFEEIRDEIVSTSMPVFRANRPSSLNSISLQPTPSTDSSRDSLRTVRKRAAMLVQSGRSEFLVGALKAVPEWPLVYWWSATEVREYSAARKLGVAAPVKFGVNTGNNVRFVRFWWEVKRSDILLERHDWSGRHYVVQNRPWSPFVMGGKGSVWLDGVRTLLWFGNGGLELKVSVEANYGPTGVRWKVCNEDWYYRPGIAFTMVGAEFSSRAHRYRSVIANKGSSVFPDDVAGCLCLMNSRRARDILASLNPGIGFEVGDVCRLPMYPVSCAEDVFRVLEEQFSVHESGREASVEFRRPAGSSWDAAQVWAQSAVDRVGDEALSPFVERAVPPSESAELSFHVGLALGRFGQSCEGVLESAPRSALPHGVLFLGAGLCPDSLAHPASAGLVSFWTASLSHPAEGLRDWLRDDFFSHSRETYENRPIYFPLSSAKRTFVAFVSIHRWSSATLSHLLSDHLIPERKALEGAVVDLRAARASGEKKGRAESDRQLNQQTKWLEELEDFIAKVVQIAEKGPPQPDDKTPEREVDAPYVMDLDDGVMVNAAALWPLLDPMWKDPKKWWKELATAKGRKDYDWSHLAARYFPSRVDEKCKKDPSLGVAHGCFWKYHPEVAYQWELRLQDEIGPDFRIDEKDSDALRKKFLKEHKQRAAELEAAEQVRRQRKANKKDQEDLPLDDAEDGDAGDEEGDAA